MNKGILSLDLDSEFTEAFIESRLTRAECAAFLGVDKSTLRRWLNGEGNQAKKGFIEALRMVAGYTPRLSNRGKQFHGWRFRNGMLFTDEGMGFTPEQIRSIWHIDQLLKSQEREIKELQALLQTMRENYAPKLPDNVILFSDYAS